MQFPEPLIEATLIKRYKRFLADVILPNGNQLTVYCPNTGKMTGCATPGSRIWLLESDNPKRKYKYTWEIIEPEPKQLVCIHSARANTIVSEAIEMGTINELKDYRLIAREIRYGEENSRADLLLEGPNGHCYVEIKSVTLHNGKGIGLFPDTVSKRATKHLRELERIANMGHEALLIFCVQHTAINSVSPAWEIDPAYAQALKQAINSKIKVLAYATHIDTQQITLTKAVDFSLQIPTIPDTY